MNASERLNGAWFNWVHGNHLVYNACWEDPRIDRVALELGPNDTLVTITSAGCNVLDYALDGPRHIHAVDMNPRQNAVLDLKIAAIRALEYEQFFDFFGRGRLQDFEAIYRKRLRPQLSNTSRVFWDKHGYFFAGKGRRKSYYFCGTSGYFAWLISLYLRSMPTLKAGIDALLSATTVEEQQNIYFSGFRDAFWNRLIRVAVEQDFTLSLLGVPRAQRHQVEQHYQGGIAKFIEDCVETVFAYLPLGDNYFWRVYLTGEYTPECCPEYLKESNFERLRAELVDRISIHTNTMEGFLNAHEGPISRFVLLDHMDWMSSAGGNLLQSEWQAIINRAAPHSRILWRSGGMQVDYIDPVQVRIKENRVAVGELLTYHEELAAGLHREDRVHTYGSFYIADLATA